MKALLKVGYTCNNSCGFCHASEHRAHGDLTTAQLRRKIARCAAAGYDTVVLSGGEPTIRGDLVALAGYARDHGLDFGLVTNGRMLSYAPLLANVDGRTELAGAIVNLGEEAHRLFQLGHRVFHLTGGMVQVGQVVVQRGFAMTVAEGAAQIQRLLGQRDCLTGVPGLTQDQCQVVQCGHARIEVVELLGDVEAVLQVQAGYGKVGAVAREHPQGVVG